jgi:peptidoglycan/LPS O-acetylase OafA/YrhL
MTLPWEAVLNRPELAIRALSGAAAWGCVLGLLGFARHHLNGSGAALAYLRESSLPIYILHSPAVVLVGYWVIQLDVGIPEKFALTLAGSVGLAMVVYHFGVRRFDPARLLFGMRGLGPRSGATAAVSPTVGEIRGSV